MSVEIKDPKPWFNMNTTSHPLAFYVGEIAPVRLSPAFEDVVRLAQQSIERPHDKSARDALEFESRAVAALLVQVAEEDGHPIMLARALMALVCRIAEKERAA